MTTTALKEYTLKDLAQMAKKRGILGWHSMRKNDLIRALVRDDKQGAKAALKNGTKSNASRKNGNGVEAKTGRGTARSVVSTSSSGRTARSHSDKARGSVTGARLTASRKTTLGKTATPLARRANGASPTTSRPKISSVARKIQKAHRQQEQFKDLSGAALPVALPVPLAPSRNRTPTGHRYQRTSQEKTELS